MYLFLLLLKQETGVRPVITVWREASPRSPAPQGSSSPATAPRICPTVYLVPLAHTVTGVDSVQWTASVMQVSDNTFTKSNYMYD